MSCSRQTSYQYPETRKGDVVDNYYGTEVADPYRWLEDDMSDETAAWVKAQNKVTYSYLAGIHFQEMREGTDDRNLELSENGHSVERRGFLYSTASIPGFRIRASFSIRRTLKEKAMCCWTPIVFLKTERWPFPHSSVSNDSKYAAYGISRGGSDWREFFVREIETGKDLNDHLEWIKFSGMAWYKRWIFLHPLRRARKRG